MGLDLELLVFDWMGSRPFSHTVLECDRVYEVFNLIRKNCKMEKIPFGFTSYYGKCKCGEEGYGEMEEDGTSSPLQCTTAGEIVNTVSTLEKKAKVGLRMGEGTKIEKGIVSLLSIKWKAILAYLRELKPDTKVALYWS